MTKRSGGVEERGERIGRDDARPRCRWCGRCVPARPATGRPRSYCRRSCRQRAYEERRRLRELSWGEDRLRELAAVADERHVAVAALRDLVVELRRDVDDGRAWDDDARDDNVRRLGALVDGLAAVLD